MFTKSASESVAGNHDLATVAAIAKAAGDPLRAGILRVLCGESFSVGELCAIFQIAQPAMSHHLKILSQSHFVTRRREGNTIFYSRRIPAPSLPEPELHRALFRCLDHTALDKSWLRHIASVHRDRRLVSERFFQNNAAKFDDQQALICRASVYAPTIEEIVVATVTSKQSLLEIGPGDGELLTTLSPIFDNITAIDNAESMLARTRLATNTLPNVKLLAKPFDALPKARKYDAVVAAMVVHHLPSPQQFFQHAQRVIRKDGVLVVAELCSHDQEWVRSACGDVWLGFDERDLITWAGQHGFAHQSTQHLAQTNGFRVQIVCYISTD